MALIFFNGLDYANEAALASSTTLFKHPFASDDVTFSPVQGRAGAGALYFPAETRAYDVYGLNCWRLTLPTVTTGNTTNIFFSYKAGSPTDYDRSYMFLLGTATYAENISLRRSYSGDLVLNAGESGSRNLAVYPRVLPVGEYVGIALSVYHGATATDGSVQVAINGKLMPPITGIDTRIFYYGPTERLQLRWSGQNGAAVDDIVVEGSVGFPYVEGIITAGVWSSDTSLPVAVTSAAMEVAVAEFNRALVTSAAMEVPEISSTLLRTFGSKLEVIRPWREVAPPVVKKHAQVFVISS